MDGPVAGVAVAPPVAGVTILAPGVSPGVGDGENRVGSRGKPSPSRTTWYFCKFWLQMRSYCLPEMPNTDPQEVEVMPSCSPLLPQPSAGDANMCPRKTSRPLATKLEPQSLLERTANTHNNNNNNNNNNQTFRPLT